MSSSGDPVYIPPIRFHRYRLVNESQANVQAKETITTAVTRLICSLLYVTAIHMLLWWDEKALSTDMTRFELSVKCLEEML